MPSLPSRLIPPRPALAALHNLADGAWRLFAVWGLGLAGMPAHLDTPLTSPLQPVHP